MLFVRCPVFISLERCCGPPNREEYKRCAEEWPDASLRKVQDTQVKDFTKAVNSCKKTIVALERKIEKSRKKVNPSSTVLQSIQRWEKLLAAERTKLTREAAQLDEVSSIVARRRHWTSSVCEEVVGPAWLATKTEIEDIFESESLAKFGYPSKIVYMPPTSPSKLRLSGWNATWPTVVTRVHECRCLYVCVWLALND